MKIFSRHSFVTSAPRQRPWHRWSKMAATVVEKAFCVLELAKTNSVTLVQCHFRRRYGKPPPTRQSIYDWSKKFQETGCLCKGKSSGRPPVSEETVERVRETFTHSPRKSTTRASEPSGSQTPRWGFHSGCKTDSPHYIFAFGLLGRRVWEIGVPVGMDEQTKIQRNTISKQPNTYIYID
jgi:hypothetical protein